MRKIVSLFSVLMLFCALAYGQTRTVTGVVRDEKGNPVPLATIKEAGGSTTVVADGNGTFSITINKGSKLIISSSGFTERQVEAGEGLLNITLSANQNLQEVVVTALGIRRKAESIGYSTTRVSPEQITAGRSANLAQSLSGKVSGLTISNTSAAVNATPRIVLRGLRSLTGDNTALIVLDGVPVPANTINYLNPNDVDRIDVLKGGQAATLFGPEGVNGALVITTKKGSQKPQITVTHSSNYEQLAYLPKTQHSFGSGSAYGSSIDEDFHPAENQQYGPRYDGSIRPLGRQLQDGSIQLVPYSDIEDVRRKYWATGYTGQSDVSYRAGDATGNFYVSFQNLSSKGIVEGDRFNRNSFRINSNKLYGKFNLSFDANYTWDHANRTATDFYFLSLNSASWAPIDQYRDWRNNKFADLSGYFNDYYDNPWWLLDNVRNDTRNNYFNGNVKLSYKPIKSLEFTLRAALANTNTYVTSFANNYRYTGYTRSSAFVNYYNNNYDRVLTLLGRSSVARNDRTGSNGESFSNGIRFNNDLYGSYDKEWGDFSLKAVAGANIQIRSSKNFNVATNGIGVSELYNFSNSSSGLFTAANGISEQRRIGGYADVTGGFRNFIYLHGVVRRDYTSVFSGPRINFNNPSFVTYGGDVSFIATDVIPGLKNNVIESIKLRAGYNRNGNDNLSAYSLQTIYPNATGFPYSGLLGTTVGNTVVSPDLKPEIVKTGELGIEISLLKNRISLEGSVYKQSAEQQILNVSVSSAIGYSSYLINAADVTNKGYELDLKVIPFKNKNWNIQVSGNYSYNTNVVNTLYGATGLNSLQYQSPDELASLNAEVGKTFPYLKTTVFQRDNQGRVIVDAADGWPLRESQRAGQGSTLPKNILGLGFVASYKNFTLVANAEYRGGFVVYHDLGNDMSFTGTGINTALYGRDQFVWPNSVYLDAAGKSVPNTNIAVDNYKAIYQGFGDINFSRGFAGVGEVYVSSGDFWKLRDVSFAYEFPSSLFRRGSVLHGVNVSVWGRNLVTLLPADNVYTDPEFSNTSGNAQGINTTLNTPPTRQLGGTVKFIF